MESEPKILDELKIDRSVFEQFVDHTLRFSETEWGGLLLGKEIDGLIHGVAMVLPPQKTQSPGYCEFRRELFQVVYNSFEKIDEVYDDHGFSIISWVHTHPDLSVFLSQTDVETFTYLTKLNPSLTAIVVDPVRYTWMAVNSRPGNIFGFSDLDLDLNYIYNNSGEEKIVEKLQLLEETINSGINRRIFKLEPKEKINVFYPIPIEELKHKLIISGLDGINAQLAKIKKVLFANINGVEIGKSQLIDLSNENKVINPEINKITKYIKKFRSIENEIRKWKDLPTNRLLYNFNINKYEIFPQIPIPRIKEYLFKVGRIINATPVYKFNIYEDFFQYSNNYLSNTIPFDKLNKIKIGPFKNNSPYFIISFKKGFSLFSRGKKLILYNPEMQLLIQEIQKVIKVEYMNEHKIWKEISKTKEREKKKREKKKREKEINKELNKNKVDKKSIGREKLDKEKPENNLSTDKIGEDNISTGNNEIDDGQEYF